MTSAIAGYLTPASIPAPLQDDALDDFLGDVVSGVTGLDRDFAVRPRWQEDPPNLPDRAVTWCAIGVSDQVGDTNGSETTAPDGVSSQLLTHETLTIIATFYGPASGATAAAFRDGLQIDQNVAELMRAGFGFVSARGPTNAPELIKEKWLQRSDIVWTVRREIRRTYPVLSLLSAHGSVEYGHGPQPFDVTFGG